MFYLINFTASGPVAASGSYTLNIDPTLTYTDAATGLSVSSFSDTFTPPTSLLFSFTPGAGYLVIGGAASGATSVFPGSNDYALIVNNLDSTPSFGGLFVGSTTLATNLFDSVGTLDVTAIVPPTPGNTAPGGAVTPEPSSFVLLGTGLLGMVAVARRRHC